MDQDADHKHVLGWCRPRNTTLSESALASVLTAWLEKEMAYLDCMYEIEVAQHGGKVLLFAMGDFTWKSHAGVALILCPYPYLFYQMRKH